MLPNRKGLLAVCLAIGAITSRGLASAFTPGDVVVFEAGNGSGDLSGDTAFACSLLEFNPTQLNQSSPVQTIPLPQTDSGTQHALTTAGQFTDHLMSLSGNGQYLSVIGYDVAAGTSYNPGFGDQYAYESPNRTIARIDGYGNVDTSTAGPFGAPGTLAHGSVTSDGSGFWYSAATLNFGSPTIGYVSFGGNTPTILSSTYSGRTLNIVSGQLYACSNDGNTPGVSDIGIGTPINGTQTIIPLSGTNSLAANPSATGFFMATLKPGDTSPDVLYISNFTASSFINKYSLEGASWVLDSQIYAPDMTDLTGTVSNGVVSLFTTSTSTSSTSSAVLSTVVDSGGFGNPFSTSALTTLVSIPITNNSIGFRGVAIAPTAGTVIAGTWNNPAGGNWNAASNWTGGVPNSVGASATFNNIGSTSKTITVDSAQTVGTITFNSTAAYSIQGVYSLTLTNATGSAAISVLGGSHSISSPLIITNGLSITTATDPNVSSPSLTLPLSINTGAAITKAGPGTLAFSASTSGIAVLNLSSLSINQGTARLYPGTAAGNRTLLSLGALAISGGSLDLTSNDLDIRASSLSSITSDVAAGYGSTITGITSSATQSDTTHLTRLGVIQNSVDGTPTGAPLYGGMLGPFDGINPAATDVLVKFTYVGDANLDGKIDGSDFSRIDAGYVNQLSGWFNGDFNYDGVVDGSDYTLIDNAFNTQGASLAAELASPGSSIDTTAVPIPEPRSLVGFVILAAGLTRRSIRSVF